MLNRSVIASILSAVAIAALAGCSSTDPEPADVSGDASAAAVSAPEAQPLDAPKAPTKLTAKLDRALVSPMGDIDGLLLEGGVVVRVPPRAIAAGAVSPGDTLDIEAWSPRREGGRHLMGAVVKKGAETLVDASQHRRGHDHARRAGAEGAPRLDGPPRGDAMPPPDGPPPGDHRPPMMGHRGAPPELAAISSTGAIVALVEGRLGRTEAVVLADGTTGRLSPRGAALDAKVGDVITLTGHGTKSAAGTGLFVESVILASGETRELEKAPPRPEKLEKAGTIQRALRSPMGDVDRLLLTDGTLVRVRPDAASAKLTAGQSVKIDGFGHDKHVFARSIATPAGASLYTAPEGPPARRAERPTLEDVEVSATITAAVRGPRGDVELLLLSDGSTVSVHGRLAHEAAAGLVEGAKVQVRGKGGRYADGASLFATELTLPTGETFKQPERGPRGHHHAL
ncbi:MAG: hypothetical protein IT374_09560 [Polyangiaceae bacterium]|nr:hypothetical protein [Polyangiaceae bacterium]